MHEYDLRVYLKSLLCDGRESLLALTTVAVDRWHNVELPVVRNLRVDLLGEGPDRRLIHIELRSTHDANMAVRMMEYCAAVYRQFGRLPEQVVLYVGEAPLRMAGGLSGPDISFRCRIVDIREMDGERLLASDRIADNIIGRQSKWFLELGHHEGELAVLHRQIAKPFGDVPAALRDRLAKMPVSEIETFALRLLDARSIEELLD